MIYIKIYIIHKLLIQYKHKHGISILLLINYCSKYRRRVSVIVQIGFAFLTRYLIKKKKRKSGKHQNDYKTQSILI